MADGTQSTIVSTTGVTLSAGDLEFLAQCLSNTNGGKVIASHSSFPIMLLLSHNLKLATPQIDCAAVAKARGQSNPRSIANRLTAFRTKTGITLIAEIGRAHV